MYRHLEHLIRHIYSLGFQAPYVASRSVAIGQDGNLKSVLAIPAVDFPGAHPCLSGHLQRLTWYTSAGAEGEQIGTDDWPGLDTERMERGMSYLAYARQQ